MFLMTELILVLLLEFFGKQQDSLRVLFNLRKKKTDAYLSKFSNKISGKLTALNEYAEIAAVSILFIGISIFLKIMDQGLFTIFCGVAILFYSFRERDIQEENVHIDAFERYYGPLFWYSILGPLGALLFNYLSTARVNEPTCVKLHAVASWVPARLVTIVYALTGRFQQTIVTCLGMALDPNKSSSEIISSCAESALEADTTDEMLVKNTVIAWAMVLVILKLIIS